VILDYKSLTANEFTIVLHLKKMLNYLFIKNIIFTHITGTGVGGLFLPLLNIFLEPVSHA
jgi:hypothetical protein